MSPQDPVETWWTDWQLALVEDRSRLWRQEAFQPHDGLAHSADGTRLMRKRPPGEPPAPNEAIVEAGWDHEHCALCWEKIATYEGCQHTGMTDGNDWLCITCYQRYILPREDGGGK